MLSTSCITVTPQGNSKWMFRLFQCTWQPASSNSRHPLLQSDACLYIGREIQSAIALDSLAVSILKDKAAKKTPLLVTNMPSCSCMTPCAAFVVSKEEHEASVCLCCCQVCREVI